MIKFDVNEILRYFAVGMLFLLLMYISMDDQVVLKQIQTLNAVNSSSLWLLGFCLLSGLFIYVIYRSSLYLLINLLVTWLVKKHWRSTFPEHAAMKVGEMTGQIDLWRLEIKSDVLRRYLSQWASYIHFLYNSAFVCWFYAALSFSRITFQGQLLYKEELRWMWLAIGSVLFLISLSYHAMYKKFEMDTVQADLQITPSSD